MGRPRKADAACSNCGEIKKHCSKGLCRKCYGKLYFKQTYPARKEALAASYKKWTQENREIYLEGQRKANRLRPPWLYRRYKITPEAYQALEDGQRGRCGICHKEKKLVVDHCHISLKVRGLLCDRCNMLLGYIEKTPAEVLERFLEYLEQHK